jgi:ferric-dicitrate binding protein FerR (iron transport regulator)
MNLNEEEKNILVNWMDDSSFVNWVYQSNEDDIFKWENYFNNYPEQLRLAEVGKLMAKGLPFVSIPKNKMKKEKALTLLMKKIEAKELQKSANQKGKVVSIYKRIGAVAAVLAIMTLTSLIYFQFFSVKEVLISTNFGEQKETILPDGSHITLNANSTLTYYSNNVRKVWLKGEAFFKVTKKPKTQENFQVLTPDLTVKVLGTAFNVNARNEKTKIFLEEGKVELDLDAPKIDKLRMEPGDLVIFSKKEKALKKVEREVSAIENISWKEGALIFNNTLLTNALYQIEDIHGIQFILETESLKEEKITGGVPIKNLNITLETLREVYKIKIRSEGKRYFISKD